MDIKNSPMDLLIKKALVALSKNSYLTDVKLENSQGDKIHLTRTVFPQITPVILVASPANRIDNK